MQGFSGFLVRAMQAQRRAQGLPTPIYDARHGMGGGPQMPDVYAQRGQEMGYAPQPPAPALGMGKPTVGGMSPPVMQPRPPMQGVQAGMGGPQPQPQFSDIASALQRRV
jgi:hypothetical protein